MLRATIVPWTKAATPIFTPFVSATSPNAYMCGYLESAICRVFLTKIVPESEMEDGDNVERIPEAGF